ncbi:hypothetical protein Csa_008628 [Cucumis sativus]|nr:hypothetical protein Csa_008628 [Cucumis sativus]
MAFQLLSYTNQHQEESILQIKQKKSTAPYNGALTPPEVMEEKQVTIPREMRPTMRSSFLQQGTHITARL